MNFVFIIQGEGRGHLTQALSLAQLLQKNGMKLSGVCVGKSKRREIPSFFTEKINAPIHRFESPNFVTDKKERKVKLTQTIIQNLAKLTTYKKSLAQIHQVVSETKPNVIINFYELLGGIYNVRYQPESQFWVIGHQYLIEHPDFKFPVGRSIQKILFKLNTKITAIGAHKKLALSFQKKEDTNSTILKILPPLLRSELKSFIPTTGEFYLAYMVNSGYGDEVVQFAKNNPSIKIEAFWDKKEVPSPFQATSNLCFHQVNDFLFLEKMAACKGLVSTAGFESVCEAMYFGKPVMMIPVQGQYEQLCNALDAIESGAGISAKQYDFIKMDKFLASGKFQTCNTVNWVHQFEAIFLDLLEESFPSSATQSKTVFDFKMDLDTSIN